MKGDSADVEACRHRPSLGAPISAPHEMLTTSLAQYIVLLLPILQPFTLPDENAYVYTNH